MFPNVMGKNDETASFMADLAHRNQAVTVILRQVPNQPLYDGLTEDALISYTLNEFKKDTNYAWPLLFPMTKPLCRVRSFKTGMDHVAISRDGR